MDNKGTLEALSNVYLLRRNGDKKKHISLCNILPLRPNLLAIGFSHTHYHYHQELTEITKHSVCSTAQKMEFSIKDFFNKGFQIRRKMRNWSHLLKKSFKENFIFVQYGFG